MAIHKGPTPAVMLIAARLARIHMAFQVNAYDDGTASISCLNQATLDAAVEQQRNQEEDDVNRDRFGNLLDRASITTKRI